LIVDGFCKKDGTRTKYNKKGTPENPKFRAVWLPAFTLNLLEGFLGNSALGPDDFIFTKEDKPIRQELAENVFINALIKAGIARSREEMKKRN
jgi:hypothetical protein